MDDLDRNEKRYSINDLAVITRTFAQLPYGAGLAASVRKAITPEDIAEGVSRYGRIIGRVVTDNTAIELERNELLRQRAGVRGFLGLPVVSAEDKV